MFGFLAAFQVLFLFGTVYQSYRKFTPLFLVIALVLAMLASLSAKDVLVRWKRPARECVVEERGLRLRYDAGKTHDLRWTDPTFHLTFWPALGSEGDSSVAWFTWHPPLVVSASALHEIVLAARTAGLDVQESSLRRSAPGHKIVRIHSA